MCITDYRERPTQAVGFLLTYQNSLGETTGNLPSISQCHLLCQELQAIYWPDAPKQKSAVICNEQLGMASQLFWRCQDTAWRDLLEGPLQCTVSCLLPTMALETNSQLCCDWSEVGVSYNNLRSLPVAKIQDSLDSFFCLFTGFFFFFLRDRVLYYVAWLDLKLVVILLPQYPKCLPYRYVQLHLASLEILSIITVIM